MQKYINSGCSSCKQLQWSAFLLGRRLLRGVAALMYHMC